MPIQGQFFGLPVATLQPILNRYLEALTAIATRGQSYSLDGRTLTAADLDKVRQTIAELQAAITRAQGNRRTSMYAQYRTPR